MGKTGSRGRMMRWAVWLSLGVVLGIVLGFAAGMTKPREQTPRIGER